MLLIKFRRLLIVFGVLLTVLLIKHYIKESGTTDCDDAVVFRKSLEDSQELMNNSTIFFLETSNTSDHKLTARQSCAIESAGNVEN